MHRHYTGNDDMSQDNSVSSEMWGAWVESAQQWMVNPDGQLCWWPTPSGVAEALSRQGTSMNGVDVRRFDPAEFPDYVLP